MAEGDEPREPAETPPGDTPPAEPPQGDTDWRAEAEKWKAQSRKHEQRARQAAAAEKRLAELEDRDKSDLERAQENARAATERANAAELRALRAEVAARKGLTANQAKRLQGTTEEELEADADELVAAFRPPDPPPPNGDGRRQGTPAVRLRPGAIPDAAAVETDPAKLAAQISRDL